MRPLLVKKPLSSTYDTRQHIMRSNTPTCGGLSVRDPRRHSPTSSRGERKKNRDSSLSTSVTFTFPQIATLLPTAIWVQNFAEPWKDSPTQTRRVWSRHRWHFHSPVEKLPIIHRIKGHLLDSFVHWGDGDGRRGAASMSSAFEKKWFPCKWIFEDATINMFFKESTIKYQLSGG